MVSGRLRVLQKEKKPHQTPLKSQKQLILMKKKKKLFNLMKYTVGIRLKMVLFQN